MQQYKKLFKDETYKNTFTNLQSCIRVNDIEEIGDGTHLIYFNMIGMFSFREWSVKETIDFWMTFLKELNVDLDYITIHPDKFDQWSEYYSEYNIKLRKDTECIWSDGEIGGYCTEFYSKGVEIGNIVNPIGTCIDVGFGLERLNFVLTNQQDNEIEVIKKSILKIVNSGYQPSNKGQGYILKKLLRLLWSHKIDWDYQLYIDECNRQELLKKKFERLKLKYNHMSKEWWFDTHGINIDDYK